MLRENARARDEDNSLQDILGEGASKRATPVRSAPADRSEGGRAMDAPGGALDTEVLGSIWAGQDLGEDQAMALAREAQRAARAGEAS